MCFNRTDALFVRPAAPSLPRRHLLSVCSPETFSILSSPVLTEARAHKHVGAAAAAQMRGCRGKCPETNVNERFSTRTCSLWAPSLHRPQQMSLVKVSERQSNQPVIFSYLTIHRILIHGAGNLHTEAASSTQRSDALKISILEQDDLKCSKLHLATGESYSDYLQTPCDLHYELNIHPKKWEEFD